jgi:hypothetical protein
LGDLCLAVLHANDDFVQYQSTLNSWRICPGSLRVPGHVHSMINIGKAGTGYLAKQFSVGWI